MCVLKVTSIASIVLERRADVPTDVTVDAECRSFVGGDVSNDACADGGERGSVEVEIAEEGSVGREREGWILEERSRLSVRVTWGRRRSHSVIGKLESTVKRLAMK